jgi:hypothetical protein
MLLFPGSAVDELWTINPRAQTYFQQMGKPAVLLLSLVCAACASAAFGLWRLRRWGLSMAVVVLATNIAGDLLNALFLRDYRALVGVPVAGVMLGYLLRKRHTFAG